MTSARDHVANALITAGVDEYVAETALPALGQWLLWRAEQLRSEYKFEDAAWFSRVASEVMT